MQGEMTEVRAKGLGRLSGAIRAPRACDQYRAPTGLSELPRTGRWRGPVPGLLGQAVVYRAALLRAARHPVPLRWWTGVVIDGSDHRSARVQSRARGRALR